MKWLFITTLLVGCGGPAFQVGEGDQSDAQAPDPSDGGSISRAFLPSVEASPTENFSDAGTIGDEHVDLTEASVDGVEGAVEAGSLLDASPDALEMTSGNDASSVIMTDSGPSGCCQVTTGNGVTFPCGAGSNCQAYGECLICPETAQCGVSPVCSR